MSKPDTKHCPYCAEEIKEEAIRCKHCQSDLVENVQDEAARRRTDSETPKSSTPESSNTAPKSSRASNDSQEGGVWDRASGIVMDIGPKKAGVAILLLASLVTAVISFSDLVSEQNVTIPWKVLKNDFRFGKLDPTEARKLLRKHGAEGNDVLSDFYSPSNGPKHCQSFQFSFADLGDAKLNEVGCWWRDVSKEKFQEWVQGLNEVLPRKLEKSKSQRYQFVSYRLDMEIGNVVVTHYREDSDNDVKTTLSACNEKVCFRKMNNILSSVLDKMGSYRNVETDNGHEVEEGRIHLSENGIGRLKTVSSPLTTGELKEEFPGYKVEKKTETFGEGYERSVFLAKKGSKKVLKIVPDGSENIAVKKVEVFTDEAKVPYGARPGTKVGRVLNKVSEADCRKHGEGTDGIECYPKETPFAFKVTGNENDKGDCRGGGYACDYEESSISDNKIESIEWHNPK